MPADESPHDVVDAAIELAGFLSSHGLQYALGGALSLGYWAAPRGTIDVDLTVYVAPDDPAQCVSILEDMNCDFRRTEAIASLGEHGFCRVKYRGYQLDVFLPTIPFYEQARARRKSVMLSGQPITIWDAETLCVFKMMFFRLKDLADVEQILSVQGPALDRQWIKDRLVEIYGARDPRIARWTELVMNTEAR